MRRSKLTEKDMAVLREADSARVQHRKSSGFLRDYTLGHRVTVHWDLNEESKRDQMFKLVIDDYEVILDAEEMMRHLRWV